jgi:hypothetical protein
MLEERLRLVLFRERDFDDLITELSALLRYRRLIREAPLAPK